MDAQGAPAGWQELSGRLAAESIAGGDPTGWFDRLYAAGTAGEVMMPWDRSTPHPLLESWARGSTGDGKRAIVVGCGLGADSEYVGSLGYDTIAFDISGTAIRSVRQRYPDSPVRYQTGDLLDLPAEWIRAFDLVVEIITVQALPDPPRHTAIVNVGRLVAPGGTLFAIEFRRDTSNVDVDGPPWPLARAEIEAFATDDLTPVAIEPVTDPRNGGPRWQAVLRRP